MVDEVKCPLVDEIIENIDCIEVRDVCEHLIKETFIDKKYTKKTNWQEICKQCKYHNY